MLALLAGMAVFQAVASHPLGEDEAVTEGRVLAPHQSPALPTYHVGMLYPEGEDGGRHSDPFGIKSTARPAVPYLLPAVHDPGYALALDPWVPTYPLAAPSPSAPVQAASGALTEEQFDALLQAAAVPMDWWADFKAIAWCESRWNFSAIGDGGNSLGLMQLWYGWAKPAGVTDLMDPLQNLIAAKYVREVRGRYGGGGGWSCANHLSIP